MNQAATSVPEDNELVASARDGDRASLDLLLRRHYDRIYAVCRRVTGNETDAADAAQEAMISIVRSLARFDGRSSFGTWVYRIATNASLDELRRRRRRPLSALDRDEDGATIEHADPNSGIRIDAVVDGMMLDKALADLSEDFRVPVVLRDVGGLDYSEIADVLGVPIGTVKSRIARGRSALAVSLGHDFGNHPHGGERPTPASESESRDHTPEQSTS